MAFEIVTKLKCIRDKDKDGKKICLTIGEIYDQQYCNTGKNSEFFAVFNDFGDFQEFDKGFFEIVGVKTRENTGWEIQCMDCHKNLTVEEFKKGECPKCGQKI